MWEEKRVAVTGASSGVGEALVKRLRALGAYAFRIERNRQAIFDPRGFQYVFLVAGVGWVQSARTPYLQKCQEVWNVNLLNPINRAQAALSSSDAHVHLVGSVQSLIAGVHHGIYAATKHGLRGWAYAAARELPGRVSISYPNGIKDSGYFSNLLGPEEDVRAYQAKVKAVLEEKDTSDDVAAGILEGVSWGGREILPTLGTYEWAKKNEVDTRRMWYPGCLQPSEMRWDWWPSEL